MFSRRRFLTDISVSSTAMLSGLFPSWMSAAINNMTEQDEQEFALFMSLSRSLSGFDDIDPDLGLYFYAYQKKQSAPEQWQKLFSKLNEFSFQSEGAKNGIEPTVLMQEPAVWDIAKAITKLWYSGWLSPAGDIPVVVKAQAYKHSLAWRVMGITAKGQLTGRLWQHDPSSTAHGQSAQHVSQLALQQTQQGKQQKQQTNGIAQ